MPTSRSKIFLSYAWGDDQPFVERLYADLSARGYEPWMDKKNMPSRGRSLPQEVIKELDGCDRVVAVLGPRAITSDACQAEREFAFDKGKVVTAVLRLGNYKDLPREISKFFVPDFRPSRPYEVALEEFLRVLEDTPAVPGPLFDVPAAPPHLENRPDELRALREEITASDLKPVVITSVQHVALQGMGGVGKTVVASMVAKDYSVRRTFSDGVIWLRFGQRPDLLAQLRLAGAALRDSLAEYISIPLARMRLAQCLQGKECLLVLDDVWNESDIEPFMRVLDQNKCSRLLVTTRNLTIVNAPGVKPHRLDVFTDAQAMELLAKWSGQKPSALPVEAFQVAQECGNLPLALAMIGAMVGKNPNRWENALHKLRNAELQKIRQEFENYPHPSLFAAIGVSVDALDPAMQQRYYDFAVLPEDTPVPEQVFETFWASLGLTKYDTQDTLDLFVSRSLAQRDDRGRITFHDLQRNYVRVKVGAGLSALHGKLLDAYRAKYPDGWHTGPNDGYFFQHLRRHFLAAGRSEELVQLVLNHKWLEAKNTNGLTFDIPLDFAEAEHAVRQDHPQRHFLPLLKEAVQRDINFIAEHHRDFPAALFQCLWNRCWWYDCPSVQNHYQRHSDTQGWRSPLSPEKPKLYLLLEDWRQQKQLAEPEFLWLRSLRPLPDGLGTSLRLVLSGHVDEVKAVKYSPDGRLIATGSRDGTLRVWDAHTGAEMLCFRGHKYPVLSVAFSPCGHYVASGCTVSVRVWNANSGREAWSKHVGQWVTAIAFSPDGSTVGAVSTVQSGVRTWEAHTGTEIRQFRRRSDELSFRESSNSILNIGGSSISFSPDGKLVGAGFNDHSVHVWNIQKGTLVRCLRHESGIKDLIFTSDGRYLVSGSRDSVRFWEVGSFTEAFHVTTPASKYNYSLAFSRDGKKMAIAPDDNSVRVWDLWNRAEISCHREHAEVVEAMAFSPDGLSIAGASRDGTVRIWNHGNDIEFWPTRDHEDRVAETRFSPDGSCFTSWSKDRLCVWNSRTGEEMWSRVDADVGVFSPLGDRLAVSLTDRSIVILAPEGGEEIGHLPSCESQPSRLEFSKDGKRLSAIDGETVRIWNSETGVEISNLSGFKNLIYRAAFSPEGNRVAVASLDSRFCIWDVETRKSIRSFDGHQQHIFWVTFSPDGTHLASASHDYTVRVWDVETGSELACLRHNWIVTDVEFSSDAKQVVSTVLHDGMWIWDIEQSACREIVSGADEVSIIAEGPESFRWRALRTGWQTRIQDAKRRRDVAWYPAALSEISTHPSGDIFGGATAGHVHLLKLEHGRELQHSFLPTHFHIAYHRPSTGSLLT